MSAALQVSQSLCATLGVLVATCPICRSTEWMVTQPSKWRETSVCENPPCIYQRTRQHAFRIAVPYVPPSVEIEPTPTRQRQPSEVAQILLAAGGTVARNLARLLLDGKPHPTAACVAVAGMTGVGHLHRVISRLRDRGFRVHVIRAARGSQATYQLKGVPACLPSLN